mgnify:CR=1 FL=1
MLTFVLSTAISPTGTDLDNAVLVFGHAHPTATEEAEGESVNLDFLHKTFEHVFCTKLKNSDVGVFDSVHNCNFRFVYAPDDEAARTMKAAGVSPEVASTA